MCYQNSVWREERHFDDFNGIHAYSRVLPLFSIWQEEYYEERILLSSWGVR
jgi:hypothetical protein